MRKLIIAVLVLISLESFAQPTNYTWYKQRIRQYSLMLDSMLYIPRYNGTPSGVRANENSAIDGAIAVDTANGRQYFYYNGSWRRLANYSELGVDSIWRVAGKDSIFWSKAGSTYKIKDSIGGGGATPTLQQVLTAGSTLTTENEINLNRNALLIVDSADNRTFVTIDGQVGNQRIVLDADDGSLYASSIELSANTSSGASLDIVCYEIGYEVLSISADGDEEKINYTSPRHSFISDRGGSYTNLVITQDSIQLLPHLGKLNIDSLRTWSAVADTAYKKPMTWDTRNGRWEYASNWFGGGGSGSTSISGLTAAAATNDINNADYGQTWRWNTLSSGAGLTLTTTSTASTDAGHTLFGIDMQGANANSNQTTYAASFVNSHTGTTSTNIGLLLQAYGGTNNYPLDLGVAGSNTGRMRLNGVTSGSIVIQPASAAGTYTLTLPTDDGTSGQFLQTDGSGVLTWAAASGGTPAGNFGNLQINRNGAFATPGSDSLDFESATGLSVKGNVNVTGLINAADGSSGNPSITFSTSDNEGFWLNGTGNLVMSNQNQNIWQTNTAAMRIKNTIQINWASGDPTGTGADIGVIRESAGLLRVTNGSSGYGDITARQLIVGSSATVAASATAAIHLYNGTVPSASITNGVLLYSEDVSSSAELKVRDEAGNITTLSPHNFGKIPGGRSEKLAWSFYSQRNGEYITADMTKALRTIENQSSEIEELKRQVAELKGLIYEMKAPVKLIHTGKVK